MHEIAPHVRVRALHCGDPQCFQVGGIAGQIYTYSACKHTFFLTLAVISESHHSALSSGRVWNVELSLSQLWVMLTFLSEPEEQVTAGQAYLACLPG